MAEQVESLDKSALLDYKGHVSDWALMQQVTQALKIQIGAIQNLLLQWIDFLLHCDIILK